MEFGFENVPFFHPTAIHEIPIREKTEKRSIIDVWRVDLVFCQRLYMDRPTRNFPCVNSSVVVAFHSHGWSVFTHSVVFVRTSLGTRFVQVPALVFKLPVCFWSLVSSSSSFPPMWLVSPRWCVPPVSRCLRPPGVAAVDLWAWLWSSRSACFPPASFRAEPVRLIRWMMSCLSLPVQGYRRNMVVQHCSTRGRRSAPTVQPSWKTDANYPSFPSAGGSNTPLDNRTCGFRTWIQMNNRNTSKYFPRMCDKNSPAPTLKCDVHIFINFQADGGRYRISAVSCLQVICCGLFKPLLFPTRTWTLVRPPLMWQLHGMCSSWKTIMQTFAVSADELLLALWRIVWIPSRWPRGK